MGRRASRSRAAVAALLATLWSAAAVGAAVAILRKAPLVLSLRGVEPPLFVASIREVVLLWGIGMTGLAGWWLWTRSRVAAVSSGGVALLALALYATSPLFVAEPRRLPLGSPVESGIPGRTTLLVGVDGMTWAAILPRLRSRELPHIARLMEEGTSGVLHSLPYRRSITGERGWWSPVVWTSIATGVEPGVHGITDFEAPTPSGGREMVGSHHRRAPAFWNLLPAFGQRVAVVGWWATWPAEEVDGFMLSSGLGFRTRPGAGGEWGLSWPPDLHRHLADEGPTREEAEDFVHERVFDFRHYPLGLNDDLDSFYSVLWQDRLYFDLTRRLIVEHGDTIDLYATYFEGIDTLSHHFWAARQDPDALRPYSIETLPVGFSEHQEIVDRYYGVMDEYLGALMAELPEESTVIVVSDHGFRKDAQHRWGGDHSPYGVLMARGPGIRRGAILNLDLRSSAREALGGRRTGILDILPTLLYLHGVPVSQELPGEVLARLVDRDFKREHPVWTVASYGDFASDRQVEVEIDPRAQEEYEDRLRSLGYID